MAVNVIRISAEDNVGVAAAAIAAGDRLLLSPPLELTAVDDIPYGHKVALESIAAGRPIIKYGEEIGTASVAITAGQRVHTHNVRPLEIPDVYVEIT